MRRCEREVFLAVKPLAGLVGWQETSCCVSCCFPRKKFLFFRHSRGECHVRDGLALVRSCCLRRRSTSPSLVFRPSKTKQHVSDAVGCSSTTRPGVEQHQKGDAEASPRRLQNAIKNLKETADVGVVYRPIHAGDVVFGHVADGSLLRTARSTVMVVSKCS